jgi:hypothetical protein
VIQYLFQHSYMDIVVATKNFDKYKLVCDLISDLGIEGVNFKSLGDYLDYVPGEEVGTIAERASKKAGAFRDWLVRKGMHAGLIVGVDDGFILPNREESADSKEITRRLIEGEGVAQGDEITLVRAFGLCKLDDERVFEVVTKIPYIYEGKVDSRIDEGKYPLRKVLKYQGSEVRVADELENVIRAKNLFYAKDVLEIGLRGIVPELFVHRERLGEVGMSAIEF